MKKRINKKLKIINAIFFYTHKMNHNATSFNPKQGSNSTLQKNQTNLLNQNGGFNQTTLFLMWNEFVKKDVIIGAMNLEIQKLQNSLYNEIKNKDQLINDLKNKDQLINDLKNKDQLINDLKNKNDELKQKNISLLSKLDLKIKSNEKLFKQLNHNKSKLDLINEISKIENVNKKLNEKIVQVENKCESMEKKIKEQDKSINEYIDAIFVYEMRCYNLNKNDL